MGAPGEAFFCENGHLFHFVEEHLYWTKEMSKESNRLKKRGCPCGSKKVLSISHYGNLNDCICLEKDIPTKGIKLLKWKDFIDLIPIPEAKTKEGKPLKAYRELYLPKYKIPEDVWSGKCYE